MENCLTFDVRPGIIALYGFMSLNCLCFPACARGAKRSIKMSRWHKNGTEWQRLSYNESVRKRRAKKAGLAEKPAEKKEFEPSERVVAALSKILNNRA